MVKSQRKLDLWFWVRVLIVGSMFIFLFYPLCTLITRNFFSKNAAGFTLENYIRFFTKKYYYNALGRSLFVSVVITLTTLVVGVFIIYIMSRHNMTEKWLIHIFIAMSPMNPPLIGVYSWITLSGRSGFITNLPANIGIHLPSTYGGVGTIIVFTFELFPYVYLYTSGVIGSADPSLGEAAESLGNSKFRRLQAITSPAALPLVAAGVIMVFMISLADFGTPMLTGEGYIVLLALMYNGCMSETGGNVHPANALSVIIVLHSTTVLPVRKCYMSRRNYIMTVMHPSKEEVLRGFERSLVTFPVILVTFVRILPQIVVLVTSSVKCDFMDFQGGFSLGSYIAIFNRLWANIRNIFIFSTVAIVFIITLGMLIPYIVVHQRGTAGQLMDLITMFPFVIPGAVLGISLVVVFNKSPVILTGTALIIVIVFVVRKLPHAARSESASLQQMDPSVEEVSISSGVSPMKIFDKVTARLMTPGALSGTILSWITCINELSPNVILYGGKISTIFVAIYIEVVRNSYDTAATLASILTMSTVVMLLILPRVNKGKVSIV